MACPVSGIRPEDCAAERLTFADRERIRELARRGTAMGTPESRQMLEHAIQTGYGGVYVRLAPGKYWMLRQPGGL
jgi:hypothetical protein